MVMHWTFQSPVFASFIDNANNSATLGLTPVDNSDVGSFSVTISVFDGEFTASETFNIVVTEPPPNAQPQLGSITNPTLLVGDSDSILIQATDVDGNSLNFSSIGLPTFASLTDHGDGSATLDLNPGLADGGSYIVSVIVSDGSLDDSQSFVISVETPASSFWLVYSETSDRSGNIPLKDAAITGDLFARLTPETSNINQVFYFLDGSSTAFKTESFAPYDLLGGGTSARAFVTTNLSNGLHTIRTRVTFNDGSSTLDFDTSFNLANN